MSIFAGVLFDKDGTLFDFAATWEVWAQAFLLRASEGDRMQAAEVGRAIGFDLESHTFQRDSIVIAGTPGEVADALAPHFPHLSRDGVFDMLNEEATDAPQAEAVPLIPFLEGLRGCGMKLGVATNDAEAPARAHLDRAGATTYFDFIAGFDSGFGGKPAPGQLLGFAQAMSLAPETVVMVGDSTHDLLAGRAAGMSCVGVLTGMADRETLMPHADVVLADIGELPGWLDAQ
ncbi:HAD family hydrolase [Sulfitobacter sp. SK012]|uniref:HAD family hydrolase n=1 Tax=Sulfitobacter sp. SK012 TaxID=1389005 RepID=UPI00157522F8|nr:HAD family hydrolase [Sulfitobacter sp. SK012]